MPPPLCASTRSIGTVLFVVYFVGVLLAAVREGELSGARMLRVTPSGATYATATVASVTTDGDLRGMVAGPCAAPAVEHWLVGGSTSVGSSGRLVLQNPGRTPATVSLEAWGASGPVVLGSQSLVVVPPGEQVVTMLEAIAPDQSRLALHVTAEGGAISGRWPAARLFCVYTSTVRLCSRQRRRRPARPRTFRALGLRRSLLGADARDEAFDLSRSTAPG